MVKIIDGEIVQDDDPRVTGRGASQPRSGGGSAAAPAAGTQGSIFDWSAPPVRLVHDPHGQGITMLPGLSVYGAPVTPTQLVMLLGAGLILGLKGLVVGAIVWFIYTSQRAQQGAEQQRASAVAQQQRVAAASSFFQNFMQQEPLGRGGRGGGPAGAGGPAGQGQAGDSSWQGKGKAYKLGN